MKIMLINSPNEVEKNKKNANYSLFPHMGIVQLGTRIKNQFREDIDIMIKDGGISNTETIKKDISDYKPDLVGISVLTPTYNEGLKIASFAKELGAIVVMGDEHAIFFADEILTNRNYVDYIINNDVGEQPFSELINALLYQNDLDRVSSLHYRHDGMVKKNTGPFYKLLNMNTTPDLNLIKDDLAIYAQNYMKVHGHIHNKDIKVITINNARGCENGRVRCSYCSIADLTINTGSPDIFWRNILHYHNEHNINLFFEVYDSFTASPLYIESLLSSMPKAIKNNIDNEDIELMIYARALGLIKKGNVDKFKKLGVKRVNIGLDSGDSLMLEAQRKNKTSNETNIAALKSLSDANITIHGSYILGAPGETKDSVAKTIEHIEETLCNIKFSTIEVSRLFPLANSPIWDIMINYDKPKFYNNSQEIDENLKKLNIMIDKKTRKYLQEKYKDLDLFNTDELISDWYKNFTHIDESYVLDNISYIDKIIENHKVNTGNNIG